jgi:hypothetical protein
MAAVAIACVGDEVYDIVLRCFVEAARQVKIGNPLAPGTGGRISSRDRWVRR